MEKKAVKLAPGISGKPSPRRLPPERVKGSFIERVEDENHLFMEAMAGVTPITRNKNETNFKKEATPYPSGNSESEIKTQVQLASQMQTPIWQALFGLLGTVFTGFIASLIIGAFLRKK